MDISNYIRWRSWIREWDRNYNSAPNIVDMNYTVQVQFHNFKVTLLKICKIEVCSKDVFQRIHIHITLWQNANFNEHFLLSDALFVTLTATQFKNDAFTLISKRRSVVAFLYFGVVACVCTLHWLYSTNRKVICVNMFQIHLHVSFEVREVISSYQNLADIL